MDKGEYDRAIADYDRAIGINPSFAGAYNGRGNAYWLKGEHDRAIADYGQAIALNPRNAEAYFNRGNAYADKGENIRAIEDIDNALRLSSDYYERNYIDNNRAALVPGALDRTAAALDQFTSDPDNHDTAAMPYYQGVRLLLTNNRIRARRRFEKAKEMGYAPLANVAQHLTNLKK